MATQICSLSMFSVFLVSVFLVCSSNKAYALRGGELNSHYHTVQTRSFLPASVCSSSAQDHSKKEGTVELVHRHGPCSPLATDKTAIPTAAQILSRDQSRVDSINYRRRVNSASIGASKLTLPATSPSGSYLITVGLGSPAKKLSLVFDTGSDLTWTQCQPCPSRACYPQKEPLLDPSRSTTYKNITCNSAQCSQLTSATGNGPRCSGKTCNYRISYGDGSFTEGDFATDTLTLTQSDVFPNYMFGCGHKQQGLFDENESGLIGLGRDRLSLVSQTASKYGNYFSYCLATPGNTGTFTLGKGGPAVTKFTPFASSSQGESFYFIDVLAIKVAGTQLPIQPSVWKTSGTIIDSGTVITRLPPTAYTALRKAFREKMTAYPMAPALSLLDTCYNLSKFPTATLPTISFVFGGNVEVQLDPSGITYSESPSQVCLGFAPNDAASELAIFGSVQQQTLQVVYDLTAGKLGFGSGGCS